MQIDGAWMMTASDIRPVARDAEDGFDDGIHLVEAELYALIALQGKKEIVEVVAHVVLRIDVFPPAHNGVLADDAFNFTRDLC